MKLKHKLIAQFFLLIILPYQPAFGQGCSEINNDQDNDGLIEICTATDLQSISANTSYELGNDIDLGGIANWDPIDNFSATLEGNGYSISNLTIDRGGSDSVGLFAGNTGTIRNLRLSTIEVTGFTRVGGLVGANGGRLINIHVENGEVTGRFNRNLAQIGLLVGLNSDNAFIISSYVQGTVIGIGNTGAVGGLVGNNEGNIFNSYAAIDVSARNSVGGLVGRNSGPISNGYATGRVAGQFNAGGLVGWTNDNVRNSYSTASVESDGSNDNIIGGLIGNQSSDPVPRVDNSYWDTIESGRTISGGGGTPQTTEELRMPTAPGTMESDVYYTWSTDDWDFGTPIQYPVLKYYSTDTTVITSCDSSEDTALPPCGTLLSGQGIGLRSLRALTENARLTTDFGPTTTSYIMEVPTNTTELQLQLTRYNSDATVTMEISDEQGTIQSITLSSSENQPIIPIGLGTTIDITVQDSFPSTRTSYTLTVKYPDIMFQRGITIEGSANEGETFTLSLPDDAIGGGSGNSKNYAYQWEYQPSDPSQLRNPTLQLSNTTSSTLTVDIPADFIARNYDQSDVVFTVTVSEADSMASTESIVTVIKQNNSDTTLGINLGFVDEPTTTFLTITVSASDEDGDITSDEDGYDSRFQYAWQSLALDDTQWRTIATEITSNTMATYEIAKGSTPTLRYRVELSYTDAQGHTTTTQFGTFRTDVDIDDDGLVEIYYLEDLDAIRHQPSGTGYQPAPVSDIALNSLGCDEDDAGTCSGYEIARHLDFSNDLHYQDIKNKATWTTGEGWSPISDLTAVVRNETAVLEGNGNTISRLRIVRGGSQGLFSRLAGSDGSGLIRNLGLLAVNVSGSSNVGGFVGNLGGGSIMNSYVSGGTVGGDRQFIGGLAGTGSGGISNSYGDLDINRASFIGGLYGSNGGATGASINNSYAMVFFSGGFIGRSLEIGGIASRASRIDNSYAVVDYSFGDQPGVRGNINTDVFDSYSRRTPQQDELKEPTGPDHTDPVLYMDWDTERWDFGTSRQFPILKYSEHCSSAPQTKRTDPPQCDTFLPDQDDGLRDLEIMSQGITLDGDQIFASEDSNYAVSFSDNTPNLKLRLKAYDSDSQISVFRHGDETDYFAGTRDDADVSGDIPLGNALQTTVTIMVREVFPETETEYTLALVNRTLRVAEEIDVQRTKRRSCSSQR